MSRSPLKEYIIGHKWKIKKVWGVVYNIYKNLPVTSCLLFVSMLYIKSAPPLPFSVYYWRICEQMTQRFCKTAVSPHKNKNPDLCSLHFGIRMSLEICYTEKSKNGHFLCLQAFKNKVLNQSEIVLTLLNLPIFYSTFKYAIFLLLKYF